MDADEIIERLDAVRAEIEARLAEDDSGGARASLGELPAPELEEAAPPRPDLAASDSVREHLARANELAEIDRDPALSSDVPLIGPLLTGLRRLLAPLVRPFVDPFVARQERFNAEVVRHLNALNESVDERLVRVRDHLLGLERDPRLLEARLESALTDYDTALRARHALLFDLLEEEIWALRGLVRASAGDEASRSDAARSDWRSDPDCAAYLDRSAGADGAAPSEVDRDRFRAAPGAVLCFGPGKARWSEGLSTSEIEARPIEGSGTQVLELLEAESLDPAGGIVVAGLLEQMAPRDWARLLRSAHARLAPGGRLLLVASNPEGLGGLRTGSPPPGLAAFLAERAGFDSVEIELRGEASEARRLKTVGARDSADTEIEALVERLDDLLFPPPIYAIVAVRSPADDGRAS